LKKKIGILINKIGIFLSIGLLVTQFSANAANGKPIDISAYKGKVVILDFWASWCTPCRKSFPWLNQMHMNNSTKGLVIIGVNVDEDNLDAQHFLEQNKALFKLIYDPKGEHASFYNIPGMPTSLIFGRDGKLIHQHSGFKTKNISEYERVIDDALSL
jgi:thiol-disulfide isomerase/thioredoxin